MAENEEQRQPIAESHQEVIIRIITKTRIRRHKQPNKDYPTEQAITKRNYVKRKSIRQRNYRQRG